MGQFQFHDLVNLDAYTVGIIIRLEKEYVEVLNMHGAVVRVKAISIQSRKNAKFAKTFDAAGNTIQAGDLIKVLDTAQVSRFYLLFFNISLFRTFSTMTKRELAKLSIYSAALFSSILASTLKIQASLWFETKWSIWLVLKTSQQCWITLAVNLKCF